MRNNRRDKTLSQLFALAGVLLLSIACASGGAGTTAPGDTATGRTAATGDEGGGVVVSTSPIGSEPIPGEEMEPGTAQPGAPGSAAAPSAADQQPTPAAPQAAALGDAEILGVLRTVHQSEVKAGELAASKASSPEVRQFAQMMVTTHQQADQQLVSTAAVVPQPGALSQLIEQQVKAVLTRLGSLPAPQFDQDFIQSQVKMHEQVLSVIDAQLLPSAQDPQVKQTAQTVRQSVQQHLQHAQQIASGLGSGSGG